jgi:predicted HAD superfamily Cof-like phosphohydrolase
MYEQSNVEDFHREFSIKINTIPCVPEEVDKKLRVKLIEEELQELRVAFYANNVVQVADAIGDLMYVVLGCAVTCGIDIEPIFHEIHRSNMTKVGGHKNVDGKWVKPETYEPAKLLPILERQGYIKE